MFPPQFINNFLSQQLETRLMADCFSRFSASFGDAMKRWDDEGYSVLNNPVVLVLAHEDSSVGDSLTLKAANRKRRVFLFHISSFTECDELVSSIKPGSVDKLVIAPSDGTYSVNKDSLGQGFPHFIDPSFVPGVVFAKTQTRGEKLAQLVSCAFYISDIKHVHFDCCVIGAYIRPLFAATIRTSVCKKSVKDAASKLTRVHVLSGYAGETTGQTDSAAFVLHGLPIVPRPAAHRGVRISILQGSARTDVQPRLLFFPSKPAYTRQLGTTTGDDKAFARRDLIDKCAEPTILSIIQLVGDDKVLAWCSTLGVDRKFTAEFDTSALREEGNLEFLEFEEDRCRRKLISIRRRPSSASELDVAMRASEEAADALSAARSAVKGSAEEGSAMWVAPLVTAGVKRRRGMPPAWPAVMEAAVHGNGS